MIASIRGEVLSAGTGWLVVAVGGVGLRVEVPSGRIAAHSGDDLFLHTSLVVREDSLTLYGFATFDELQVFGVLLGVSGVGPRSALGVLAALTPVQIAQAAAGEDERPFRKVSGIGPKTAKLIAVQLAGKLDPRLFEASEETPAGTPPPTGSALAAVQVTAGLVGLGYAQSQAESAVQAALDAGAGSGEAELLRASLVLLQAPKPSGRVGSAR